MRLIVFFDLPTKTALQRRAANEFRKFLIKDGYIRLQLSIYWRVCNGIEGIEKHKARLKKNLPCEGGSIRTLFLTDKQFCKMDLLVGVKSKNEEKNEMKQLILL